MVKILLIDDSEECGALVKRSLMPMDVIHALDLKSAREILKKTSFDLIMIDVSLPDGDGFDFCQELSADAMYTTTPLILLTAKDEVSNKVFGLNCGACDYVTKPFQGLELKARVDAHLRRNKLLDNTWVKTRFFELNTSLQKCFLLEENGRRDAELTPTEYRVLMTLFKNRGVALTREEIINTVWSASGVTVEQKGLDTHIAHLRRKLGPVGSRIVSIYGKGYVLSDEGAMPLG